MIEIVSEVLQALLPRRWHRIALWTLVALGLAAIGAAIVGF